MTNPSSYGNVMLPQLLDFAVTEIAWDTKAPKPLIATSLLMACSLACQGIFDVERPNGILGPLSLFALVIAESGERKSGIDKKSFEVFENFDKESNEKFKMQLASHQRDVRVWTAKEKGLLKEISKASNENSDEELEKKYKLHYEKKPRLPIKQRFFYSDVTPAGLKKNLNENSKSIIIISDDAKEILFGNAFSDLTFINRAWERGTLSVDRRSSESFTINDYTMSVSLMVQNDIFQDFILHTRGKRARASGMFARFLICRPWSTKGSRFETHGLKHIHMHYPLLMTKIKSLVDIYSRKHSLGNEPKRNVLKFSYKAGAIWTDYINLIESQIGETGYYRPIHDWAAKIGDQVARIAAIFHIIDSGEGEIISEINVQRAISVGDWYLSEAMDIFGDVRTREEINAEILLKWIDKKLDQSNGFVFSQTQSYLLTHSPLRESAILTPAIVQLQLLKEIIVYKSPEQRSATYIMRTKRGNARA